MKNTRAKLKIFARVVIFIRIFARIEKHNCHEIPLREYAMQLELILWVFHATLKKQIRYA
ncbi:MAG: hypothetical protein M0Q53_08445 [Prolixibacteraceae bacterium]|nr:hypothetical protein [Prolixibacteraceae bacterium]